MTCWRIVGIATGVLVLAAIAVNTPDLIRFVRISSM